MLKNIDSSWSKDDPQLMGVRWKKGERVERHSFSFFNIDRINYEHPKTKKEYPFYRFNTREWVGIFALTDDGKLLVIEQYRFGVDEVTLEVPGGVVDGDDFEDAVVRELEEETGYTCGKPILLGSLSTNSALMNNRIHFYYAPNAVFKKPLDLDETECIETKLISVEDFDTLINKGEVNHALIVGGFLLFKNKVFSKMKGDRT